MPEVCSQRNITEKSIARQRLVRHVSAATDTKLRRVSMEVDSWRLTRYGMCFRVNEYSTNVLHGYH
jgi:hypothetical protein